MKGFHQKSDHGDLYRGNVCIFGRDVCDQFWLSGTVLCGA